MERDITESGFDSAADHEMAVEAAERHPAWPATGDARVDHALRGLDGLADLPVSEHPPVFERIHGQLVEVLGELRSGPATGAHGRQAD